MEGQREAVPHLHHHPLLCLEAKALQGPRNFSHLSQSDQDWRFIARLIVGRNATQCKYKWLARSKFKLVQVPWSKEEDEALSQIYLEYQKMGKHSKWSEIAKEIALRCRTSIVR